MAFINYPPVPAGSGSEGVARASAHKDWGSLTLLFQEEEGTPGLEVFLPDAAVEASKASRLMQLMADLDLKGERLAAGLWPLLPQAHTLLAT